MNDSRIQADAPAAANVGGAVAVAPIEPQAQGAASAAVDTASIAQQVRDSLFAELRRSGVLKGPSKPTAPAPESSGAAPAIDLRPLDRALMRSGQGAKLTDQAIQRMERAFQSEAPSNADEWVGEYLGGFGVTNTPTVSQPQIKSAVAPPSGPPVSDAGGLPVSRSPVEQQDLVHMSESDRAHVISTKGISWYVTTLNAQLKGRKIQMK